MNLAIIAGLGAAVSVILYLVFGARMAAKQRSWQPAASMSHVTTDEEALER